MKRILVTQRRRYKTKQREAVVAYMASNCERYLSVDDVWAGISVAGEHVGRTTVYRALEAMVAEGLALKATAPNSEARYRQAGKTKTGQLVCLSCGRALTLDCSMVGDFESHVLEHHGFSIDASRTVLYGLCGACREVAS